MFKNKKQKIKTSTFIIGFILVVQTLSFALAYKANFKDQQLKTAQINSLIQEIGELKEDNDGLHQRLNAQTGLLSLHNEGLGEIGKHYSALKDESKDLSEKNKQYSEKVTNLQQQTTVMQSLYQKQLNEKQQMIAKLVETTEQTKKMVEVNDKIKSYLLLGENQGLTDTLMLIIINPGTKKITLMSIPRDLSYEGRKINEYYEKFGIEKLKSTVASITGLTIDGYVKINFQAFKDFIDLVGGVDIEIEKTITDDQFPGENNSYEKVTFEKGTEHMDGERALKYARSRKSTSDFDRIQRQQQIIKAVKEKMKDLGVINNLSSFYKAYQSIEKNLTTDVNLLEILSLFEEYKDFTVRKGESLNSQNFLYSSKSASGQYILLPFDNSFNKIKGAILKDIEN